MIEFFDPPAAPTQGAFSHTARFGVPTAAQAR